jgi:hypothetical protein
MWRTCRVQPLGTVPLLAGSQPVAGGVHPTVHAMFQLQAQLIRRVGRLVCRQCCGHYVRKRRRCEAAVVLDAQLQGTEVVFGW